MRIYVNRESSDTTTVRSIEKERRRNTKKTCAAIDDEVVVRDETKIWRMSRVLKQCLLYGGHITIAHSLYFWDGHKPIC